MHKWSFLNMKYIDGTQSLRSYRLVRVKQLARKRDREKDEEEGRIFT